MIVVDTSLVYALLDRADDAHASARAWYEHVFDELATTPLVLAEVDHLAGSRAGRAARAAFRSDLANGAYGVEWWPSAAGESVEVAERYADLGVSLTDASLVALAGRLETTAIATFDERHFRAMRPLGRERAFTLLPADTASA
jgi:predicted nucleic acid-binding protein